jgi:hypothetical protein
MSYPQGQYNLPVRLLGADVDDNGQDFAPGSDSAGDLIATAIVGGHAKVRLLRVGCLITETCAGSSTTPVIKVWKNGTSGTLLATLTLATSAAGVNAYEDLATSIELDAGDRIDFELDVVAAGTPTGHGIPWVYVEPIQEVVGNVSDFSAV